MKKAVTYILIFLVSFACSYETMEYFSKTIGDTSIAWIDDISCQEKSSESEESNEKNEKKNFSDDSDLNNYPISSHIEPGNFHSKQNSDFSSSDYSQVVYSPPEML